MDRKLPGSEELTFIGLKNLGSGLLQVPLIQNERLTLSSGEWGLDYYTDYVSHLRPQGQWSLALLDLCEDLAVVALKHQLSVPGFLGFRKMITVGGAQFLLGVLASSRTFKILSPHASRELVLLKHLDQLPEVSRSLLLLKDHTDLVVSLDPKLFPSQIEELVYTERIAGILKDNVFMGVEEESKKISQKLVEFINEYSPTLFERFSDKSLALTVKYGILRIHLLRFLAMLPSLDHDKKGREVKRLFLESFRRLIFDSEKAKRESKKGEARALPALLLLGVRMVHGLARALPAPLFAWQVRFMVRLMAKRFIAGESIEQGLSTLGQLRKTQRDATLDQLGELVVSEAEADFYMEEVLKLVRGQGKIIPKGEKNGAGIWRAHVSIKVSALTGQFRPQAPEYTYAKVAPRLKKILLAAQEENVFINIDAEHYHYRDLVLGLFRRVLLETPELKNYQQTGIVIQAYLRDAHLHLMEIVELAKMRGLTMPVRLVKGAYYDAETVEARAHDFNAPQFLNKEETDLNFRALIYKILEAHPHLQLCLGSHNFSDHAFAEVLREKEFPGHPLVEHQCLHMTYEALSTGMARMGMVVRNYVPIGSLLMGMAYLVRRILENSSQVGVLTQMHSHKKVRNLISPREVHFHKIREGKLERDYSAVFLSSKFKNVSPLRLYLNQEREIFFNNLNLFTAHSLGKTYGEGSAYKGLEKEVYSSSDPQLLVGKIRLAAFEDVEPLLARMQEGKSAWQNSTPLERASIVLKAAELMRLRRDHLSSLIIYEAGKNMAEALGDVDEAIDFMNFYAREELKLKEKESDLRPRGLCAVISPWNFPLAIPCGMVVAPLVSGNTVILKSAEQTPLIAQVLIDLLHEAGVPHSALAHLPGKGSVVGSRLVEDPGVRAFVFTGSKAVGTQIYREAMRRLPQGEVNRVITEMGGKNAIVISANAELDESLSGTLFSAFSHAGQKCSAASRVLIHHSIKDKFIERLRQAARDLEVGRADDWGVFMNPVVSAKEKERLRAAILSAREECERYGGRVVLDRSHEDLPGHCVGPAIFELPYARALHPDSFAQKELFGPVIHVVGFETLPEAVQLFNSTEYALTGGVFSQSQDDLDYFLKNLKSGNLYVNRGITGARVAIEPFGGFKMSGTGPKAGGRDYLRSFVYRPVHHSLAVPASAEAGSDYDFDLCGPSGLNHHERLKRVVGALSLVLQNFETLMLGVFEKEKEGIKLFRDFVKNEAHALFVGKHSNLHIPGQLSYDDYRLPRPRAVVLSFNDRPRLEVLLYAFGALTAGTGLTVICRQEKSYAFWSKLAQAFHHRGLSKKNFDVFYVSTTKTAQVMKQESLASIIVDGPVAHWQDFWALYLGQNPMKDYVASLLGDFDPPRVSDPRAFIEAFVLKRSVAQNTMRHGAALELE